MHRVDGFFLTSRLLLTVVYFVWGHGRLCRGSGCVDGWDRCVGFLLSTNRIDAKFEVGIGEAMVCNRRGRGQQGQEVGSINK